MTAAELSQLAERAHQLVGIAPRRAVQSAGELARLAHNRGDPSTESQALRAMGRAYRELGELDQATAVLRKAVRLADQGHARQAAADARMTLAYLLFERGRTQAALDCAAAADGLHGSASVPLLGQRAALLQRCGQVSEALECYRRALPMARAAGRRLDEAHLCHNRALLYVNLGRLAEAETDAARAELLYTALDQPLSAADSRWSLGVIATRRGDVPAALRLFDDTEATYRRHDLPVTELLVTRGELLLSVGLFQEARETAERATAETASAGRPMLHAEALLLLAQAALANRDPAGAIVAGQRATELFIRQKRPGWTALARYYGLRAEERATPAAPGLRRRALRLASVLASMGWPAQELDARLIAARIALNSGNRAAARRELVVAAQARSSGPLELRIRAWYAEALRRLADDDRTGAERALRAGLGVLDQYRAMLGATELRVRMAGHGTDLAILGMSLALKSGSAPKALAWAERWRARALWHPSRPPVNEDLAGLLARLRQVTVEVEATLLDTDGGPTQAARRHPARPQATLEERGRRPGVDASTEAVRRHLSRLQASKATLEEQVRRLARTAAGSLHAPRLEPPSVRALADRLADRVLVEIIELDGAMFAVWVRDGTAGLQPVGECARVQRGVAALLFALRRLAVRHGDEAAMVRARVASDHAARRLDDELLKPLCAVLGDQPLVLIPPAVLQAVPWSVLPSLRQRPVTIAPSATIWQRAETAATSGVADSAGPVLLAAGPGLPGATREVADLVGVYERAVVLTGEFATVDSTLAGLDGASVAHIAAHGRVRVDNPLFSALDLADGQLTVYDLERLQVPPRLVLLPACQSGVGQALAGDEMMGLTATLFALGTRTVVATVIPVPDEATRSLMLALHDGLRRGLPPATALTMARTAVDQDDPSQLATAAAFCCYGAG